MSLNYTISRLAEMGPESREFVTLDGDRFCEAADEAAAQRIEACVNACKDITTEHLTQFPNWKLAVGNMARPGDVANLILKLGAYREALAQIAARDRAQEHEDNYMLACRINAIIGIAQEALK